jgi:hypothetical protein
MADSHKDAPEQRFMPTAGLSYDPNDDVYWDGDALEREIDRTFELCHGCRMCKKYCQSFSTLFDAADAAGGADGIAEDTPTQGAAQCRGAAAVRQSRIRDCRHQPDPQPDDAP